MRYKAIVQYDGTNYFGWQKQGPADQVGVSEVIEKVISCILNIPTTIQGSGRTDRRVHALHQVFHFDAANKIRNLSKFVHGLNSLLPPDIHIVRVTAAKEDFHARYSIASKTYLYCIRNGEYNPFLNNYSCQIKSPLDIKLMRKAANLFKGSHSFINFTTKETDEANFVRTISSVIFRINSDGDIDFYIRGSGFMRYMVRFIVGSLIQVGLGRIDSEYISELLENTNIRHICQYKAEPQALYLFDISYIKVV